MVGDQRKLLNTLGSNHVAATILTCSLGSRVNVMVFHEGHWQNARVLTVRNLPETDDLVQYLVREQASHRVPLLKKTRDYLHKATSLVRITLVNNQGLPGQFKRKVFRLTNICVEETQQFFDMRELFLAVRRVNEKINPRIIAKIEHYLQEVTIPRVNNSTRPVISFQYYLQKIKIEWKQEKEECRKMEQENNLGQADDC